MTEDQLEAAIETLRGLGKASLDAGSHEVATTYFKQAAAVEHLVDRASELERYVGQER
ncbi:hypothetical protein SAMN05216266_12761 [Amycolatopsis marina]|uniref:Uncharacterized protein n=1 Tax=Amycolatopsis marina TaxID=490629 RepID=A0A1I1CF17_9PSEU|nr:hypothetical protein SAMN05216266_12761 [Amycolatopsis marina]